MLQNIEPKEAATKLNVEGDKNAKAGLGHKIIQTAIIKTDLLNI